MSAGSTHLLFLRKTEDFWSAGYRQVRSIPPVWLSTWLSTNGDYLGYHFVVVTTLNWFLFAVALTNSVVFSDAAKSSVTVFITSEVSKDGWIAPGAKERADSARDLAGAISYKKGVLLVTTDRESADLLVRITSREVGETTGTIASVSPPGVVYSKVRRGRMIWATVYVGDLTFEFLGTTERQYWTAAANDLARDLERWAKDNYEKIVERRRHKSRQK